MQTLDKNVRSESRFRSAFELNEGHTLNGSNPNLHGLRKAAMAQFDALGLPAPKSEAWKYTNISRVLQHDYQLRLQPEIPNVSPEAVAAQRIPGLDGPCVVLINGRFAPTLSTVDRLPEGVLVMSLATASERHTELFNAHFGQYATTENAALTALNTAFTQDGLFIYVPRNVVVETPIQILHLAQSDVDLLAQPRHLIVVEQSAQVTLVDVQESLTATATFSNSVTECYVGANAHATLYLVQDEGMSASQVNTVHAYQEGDSNFTIHTTTLSGAVVRNNVSLLADAENCETHMFGLFIGDGNMHVDNHTFMDHAKPHCESNELYKGVLNDRATGVFNGKVMVRQDAQKINAYQSNKAIVLTETAHMYSKPELEIYADDVRCSHGATTGQVEPEAVFYLRSRGLTERQARKLLLLAFARDVLDNIKVPALREYLDAKVETRLPA